MKVPGLLAMLAACNFSATRYFADGAVAADASAEGSDAAIDSAEIDAPVIMPDARACFGREGGLVTVCLDVQPTGGVNLPVGPNPINTSNDPSCDKIVGQQAGPPLCVIAGINVTVSGALVAVGDRPLVLVATDTLVVNGNGTIDVSSVSGPGARRGAGGNAAECSPSGRGRNDSGGAGGGAGGSFGTIGGPGGTGDQNNNNPPNEPATGGNPGTPQPTPTIFHGGCSGGAGGTDTVQQQDRGGLGGDGGGAVYLIAAKRISIDGNVFASGGGGRVTVGSGGFLEGGGGGGSGGMIVLDAPTIDIQQGRVVANGGGGAGGGGAVGGGLGGDGTTTQWDRRAARGTGDPVAPPNGPAGDGAEGTATGRVDNLSGENSRLGGGGGAGGLGVIWTYGTLSGGAMMSPAPNQH